MLRRNTLLKNLIALLLCSALLGLGVLRAQVSWDNGNGNSLWATGANWNPNGTPTSSSNVTFGSLGLAQVISLGATSRDVGTLTFTSPYAYTLNGNSGVNLNIATSGSSFTQSGSGNLTLNTGLSFSNPLTMSGTGTGTVTLNGPVSSGASDTLTKSGSFTLVLNGANSHDGTVLNSGTLVLGSSSALGLSSREFQINGGTLQATGGTQTVSNNVRLGGDFTISGSNALVFTGNFNLGGVDPIITVNNTTTISGNITQPWYSSFTKAGSGNLVLEGTNSYSGTTAVSAGTLTLRTSSALGATGTWNNLVSSGATLALDNNIAINEGGFNIAGSGVGGAGVLRNISGNNSLAGQITLDAASTIGSDAGTLSLTSAISMGSFGLSTTGAGNIVFANSIWGSSNLNLNGTGTVSLTGSNALSFSGNILVNAGTLSLGKTGSNAIQPSLIVGNGSNAATVLYNAAEQIANSTNVTVNNLGLLNLNNYSDTIANLTLQGGSVTTGTGTLTLSTSGNTVTSLASSSTASISGKLALGGAYTFSVADGAASNDLNISAVISGSQAITKSGAGTLTLAGVNTYSGALSVTQGTLRLGTNNALPTASALSISSGATLDINSLSASVNALTSAGTLALGNSGYLTLGASGGNSTLNGTVSGLGTIAKLGAGSLTLNSSLSFAGTLVLSGGTLVLGSGVNVSLGTLRISGNSVIDFSSSSATSLSLGNLIIDSGVTLTLTNWINGSDYFLTQAWQDAQLNVTGQAPMNQVVFSGFNANQTAWRPYGSTNQVTPVPEPATTGALLTALTLGLFYLRRRKP